LREIKPRDYAIRILLGGVVSVLAALIGQWVNPRFGGIFTAFPAILLASLTLIGQHQGDEPSAEDAEGGAVGSVALAVTAVFIALTITIIAGAIALLAALAVWLVLAVAQYALGVKIGWLPTRQGDEQKPPPADRGGPPGGDGFSPRKASA
jgi:hypothetical protein